MIRDSNPAQETPKGAGPNLDNLKKKIELKTNEIDGEVVKAISKNDKAATENNFVKTKEPANDKPSGN